MRKIKKIDSAPNLFARLVNLAKEYIPPVHSVAKPYLISLICLGWIGRKHFWLRFPALILTGITSFFFRNPVRVSPQQKSVMVAPADGTITEIATVSGPAELHLSSQKFIRISIFLSIFNVHIQRIPATGIVKKILYVPGKFLSADRAEAVEENERNHVVITTGEQETYVVTQVAGTIARRIKCYLAVGDKVTRGETYGLIKFGSRLNLLVPTDYEVQVAEGQHTLAGETILASRKAKC